MADTSKTGTDWQDEELDAIVADYFAMLGLDAAGQPFVKAQQLENGHTACSFVRISRES